MNEKLKDFKKCPACGQKNYECFIDQSAIISCSNEKVLRPATHEEVEFWNEQDGFENRSS